MDGAIRELSGRYEPAYGGFGAAQKFPPSQELELLMAEYERTGEERLLRMVVQTLEMMALGGMHDHLGGGFHRYSTDGKWHVPHFEKMLYNQAQLSKVYLRAYALTDDERFRHTAEGIFRFVEREMTGSTGGFYSALDSETDGLEGKYYLWTEQEIRDLLGAEADLFFKAYDLSPMPEGEGNVIYMPRSLKITADSLGVSEAVLRGTLASAEALLLGARWKRERPLLDTKILTAWNGLMIDAFAYAYQVLDERRYLRISQDAAEFVLTHLRDGEGNLYRSYKDGETRYRGYQEDYAFLIRGLLGIYRASGEASHLDQAAALADRMAALFWDGERGGFFFTDGRADLIARPKSPYDSAIPSGNSVAAHALLSLGRETGRQDFLDKAQRTMQAFSGAFENNPGPFKHMALAVHR